MMMVEYIYIFNVNFLIDKLFRLFNQSLEQFSENVWEDSSVFVVGNFWLGIKSDSAVELDSSVCGDLNFLSNLVVIASVDCIGLCSLQTESF